MAADTAVIDRYGVMGYPIAHSRSPVIHQLFAQQTGQNMRYELLKVTPEHLDEAVRQFRHAGGKGLNITVPHKVAVAALCDQLSERARLAGAVNTLVFQDNETFGDNTDGIGLLRDLLVNYGLTLEDANILVLGAGGATRGIVAPLLEQGPQRLLIANRTPARAEALVERFATTGPVRSAAFDAIPDAEWDLVINATSAGYKGETPPFPASVIGPGTFCYDLSYAAKPTPFCAWAKDNGATTLAMGWGMLIEQAAESFHLWRGVRPDTRPILKQLVVSAS